ncbi:hypothetical protein GPECTOR_13g708 [Gonium pectorale]|uniref:Uncharacterized protein n=1 Tax=Gonium pectorale TaxID=33097 RepID=A0A150GN52_GONPE|nr:hypothetical protein GPECTOR_13g708 [Gonium pectorale]|eukprot:KXZ51221.1 hypothetical protein GPECTOR_13g708 [Gonium pectorale]
MARSGVIRFEVLVLAQDVLDPLDPWDGRAQDLSAELRVLKDMVGAVLEGAAVQRYTELGVRGPSATLTDDLLINDVGVLTAVVTLLMGEKNVQEAAKVQALLDSGQSLEARRELLEGDLFVRCVAAVLCKSYTGVLEVDAGVRGGCQVDEGAQALRLRLGQTAFNPKEVEAAHKQLAATFTLAAYTLDKVLASGRVGPMSSMAPPELQQLPDELIVEGICLYAGTASGQRTTLQRTALARRRVEASERVISAGGLQSAVLQVRVQEVSAR